LSDRAKIVVHPSGADSDLLPARDVLNHVLDFLALLSFAEPASDTKVVWLLEKISSNSPVAAEVLGAGEDAVYVETTAAMAALAEGIDAATEGKKIPAWMLNGAFETAVRFFKRNTETVGRTDITLNDNEAPIYVPAAKARAAVNNLERARLEEEKKAHDWTHTAFGSIEGYVMATGRHYNKPAIWIRERKSKRDIRCVFDAETAQKVGSQFKWETAWGNGRVIVEGLLQYDKAGDVQQVSATDVIEVSGGAISISEFADPTFTNGLSPDEYLELWRDRGRE